MFFLRMAGRKFLANLTLAEAITRVGGVEKPLILAPQAMPVTPLPDLIVAHVAMLDNAGQEASPRIGFGSEQQSPDLWRVNGYVMLRCDRTFHLTGFKF